MYTQLACSIATILAGFMAAGLRKLMFDNKKPTWVNTYNMGVGMSVVVPAAEADKALQILKDQGVDAYLIGEIIGSEEKITIV